MAQLSALRVNFPNDRDYTYQALVEELALMERHARDGSWKSCACIPEKHLPLVAGLSSEGFGFTEDPDEKWFMGRMMDQARIYKAKMAIGIISPDNMDEMRGWAREMRHRVEERNWRGEYVELEKGGVPKSVRALVDDLNELENPLSLVEIEEDTAWRMVNFLCDKHGVPPPKEIRFTDACNPLLPNAAHIQRDEVKRTETHYEVKPRPDLDILVFCRGGLTAFAVAHEFDHYRNHYRGKIVADEAAANKFALKEVRSNLYTAKGDNKPFIVESRNKLTGEKGMALDTKKGLEVGIGLTVAKLVDKYDGWFETQFPGYAQSAKIAAGAALTYIGLKKGPALLGIKGWAKDIALFAGMELILNEVFKIIPGFAPTPPAARAAAPAGPVAIPGAPGRAVIAAASPYTRMWATPTRLTAGYPQVAQVDHKWLQVRV